MKYLLDTCTVSDFVKGHPNVLACVKATPPDLIAVSVLTRMEVDYGLALNAERARKLAPMLDAFFSTITTLPFDEADAKATAAIRASLKIVGQPIGAYDRSWPTTDRCGRSRLLTFTPSWHHGHPAALAKELASASND